jgi:chemotaxis protein methyltransferase CheR
MTANVVLTPDERGRLLELVDAGFGIRGSGYAATRLDEAMRTILPRTDAPNVAQLLGSLQDQPNRRWLSDLVEQLTVGETYFLRDASQLAALRERILPDLVARRQSERRLRLWSAGCSTGEEVYSVAMLLREANLTPSWDISLIGTDVNRAALRVAREGQYAAWSFRAMPDSVRDRYFEPVASGWQLSSEIRYMARFAWMNLGADPPLPPSYDLDLIICRNVTIYFNASATQRLYRTLVAALAPGGWLLLGPSDPLPTDRRGLERVECAGAVAWRRVATPRPAASPTVRRRAHVSSKAIRVLPRPRITIAERRDELEAGLLALEAGSTRSAVDWLRRATFRDPESAVAQFALAQAYVDSGDRPRAQVAFRHTRRLLAPLEGNGLVPGSDSMSVQSLRQTIETFLVGLAA